MKKDFIEETEIAEELESLKDDIQSLRAIVNELQGEVYSKEAKDLKDKVEYLEAENARLNSKIDELQTDVNCLESEI